MKVCRMMSRVPVTVVADASVRTALRRLADHQITMMPVVDHRGRIVGVVAEGDLIGVDDTHPVKRVMRCTTVLVHPETEASEAWAVLRETGVKSLPVVDAADQVVGVVSRSDLVRMLAREDGVLQEEIVDALCLAGMNGWRVEVRNGVADLVAPDDTAVEGAVAAAQAVLGVHAVHIH